MSTPVTIIPANTDHDLEVPVVFDSPHSGIDYPDDFGYVVSYESLRAAEDTHVDKLYSAAPSLGATFIAANFPRAYIDCNRSLLDMDAALLDAPWPGPVNPSGKTERGIGLVWRKLDTGDDIYDRKLSVAEVQHRIVNYYAPYHKAVRDAINATHKHYGAVWHINCHSMPAMSSVISDDGPGHARADFVLGDRDGTSCAPEFTTFVAHTLRDMGYDVRVNDPYKGVELVRAYSDPEHHKHSLQIEVNRKLYMDETSRNPNENFAKLQHDITRLINAIGEYAKAHIPLHAHHDCGHDHAHDHKHGHDHAHDHAHDHTHDHAHDDGHKHDHPHKHDHKSGHDHTH